MSSTRKMTAVFKKAEYELPIFLILAIKLPFEQVRFYGPAYYLSAAVLAALLGGVLRKSTKDMRTASIVFAALLLAADSAKSLLMPAYSANFMLCSKAFSLLCFLLCVMIIKKSLRFLHKPIFDWFVPVLCAAGILSGPAFLLNFLPVILLLGVYENRASQSTGKNAVMVATVATAGILAFILLLYGINGGSFYIGFLAPNSALSILPKSGVLKAFVSALPLFAIFTAIWLKTAKSTSRKGTKRLMVICAALPLLNFVVRVFLYYPASDSWGYQIAVVIFTQACLLFYLLGSGEKEVMHAFDKVIGFLKERPLVLLMILIYLLKVPQLIYPV